jgi:hypothetical protein
MTLPELDFDGEITQALLPPDIPGIPNRLLNAWEVWRNCISASA